VRFLASLGLAILMMAAQAETTLARGRGGSGLVSVRGYVNSRGTYVPLHFRTRPNGSPEDNLFSRGGTYGSPESVLATTAVTTSHPPIASDGPQSIPGPTTWTDTGLNPKAPWCASGRIVGAGAGFCIIN
jgi:hypothetical protein